MPRGAKGGETCEHFALFLAGKNQDTHVSEALYTKPLLGPQNRVISAAEAEKRSNQGLRVLFRKKEEGRSHGKGNSYLVERTSPPACK